MINKNIISILIVSFLLILSGCGGSSSTNAKTDGFGSAKTAFNGGSDGLSIEFTEGQPPKKIFDNSQGSFNIRLLVKNLGESDIADNKAHIALSGISPADFNVVETYKSLTPLTGVKKQGDNVIEGQIQPVMFTGLKYVPKLNSGITKQNILVDMCYPYETKALVNVCISGNTLRTSTDNLEVCKLNGDKSFANSGAPIGISNVKQSVGGKSKIMLQFDIVQKDKNKNSRVFELGSLDNNCKINGNSITSSDASLKRNYVNFNVDGRGLNVDCGDGTSSGKVLLSDSSKKATVYCTIDTTNEDDYEKAIGINLDYDYFNRIDTSINIEHIDG